MIVTLLLCFTAPMHCLIPLERYLLYNHQYDESSSASLGSSAVVRLVVEASGDLCVGLDTGQWQKCASGCVSFLTGSLLTYYYSLEHALGYTVFIVAALGPFFSVHVCGKAPVTLNWALIGASLGSGCAETAASGYESRDDQSHREVSGQ